MTKSPLIRRQRIFAPPTTDDWTAMVQFLKEIGVGGRRFSDYLNLPLVGGVGTHFEPLSIFLTATRGEIGELRQVGPVRSKHVQTNLELIAQHHGFQKPGPRPERTFADALFAAGVPKNYPVAGCFFPEGRVLNSAAEVGIVTLEDLFERATADLELGSMRRKDKSQLVFGPITIQSMESFFAAVATGDRQKVQEHVPLLRDRVEPDMGLLVRRFFAADQKVTQHALHERFVVGKTFEEVARKLGVKHQRVQQVAADLVSRVTAVCRRVPDFYAQYVKQWSIDGAVKVATQCGSEESEIAAAIICTEIENDPANQVRHHFFETECETLFKSFESTLDFNYGCLDVRQVLQSGVQISLSYIVRWSSKNLRFRFEPDTGFIRPHYQTLFNATWVIVARKRQTIVELLCDLQRVPGLDPLPPLEQMKQQIGEWRKKHGPDPWDNVDFRDSGAAAVPDLDTLPTVSLNARVVGQNTLFRDRSFAQQVKVENEYRCQICNLAIALPAGQGLYAESHHIKPVGKPDYGADVRSNLLCVCPYHHVLLDYGVITLDKAKLKGTVAVVCDSAIAYHNEHIFGRRRFGQPVLDQADRLQVQPPTSIHT